MTPIAKPDSWKTLPMPAKVAVLEYAAEFSAEEFERISRGFIPEAMEDKWFIYLDADTLCLHRSWTGHCIYKVEFAREGGGHVVRHAIANRDPVEYTQRDNAYDARLLDFLIRNLLLGAGVPFPMPKGLPGDAPRGLYQHHVAGTGYPEKPVDTS